MEKILLVDDDQSARVTLSIALKSEGFSVEIVDKGDEALRRISNGSYEWVISDVNMPGMNGIELVHKIHEVKPKMQVILISAFRSQEELQNLNIHGFLEKPIDTRKLYQLLRHEHLPLEETFEPRITPVTDARWMWQEEEKEKEKSKDVIRFKDSMERLEFEKRTFGFYEVLEKKVEERTHELLEKQKNLEDAYFELRKTKLYLENLIDSSPGCVISVDIEKSVLSFNTTAEKTFGFGRDEVLRKPIGILRFPKSSDQEEEIYQTTMQEGKWSGEIQGIRKNGEVFPLCLTTSRLLDENEKVIALLVMCRDITEEKKMEQQFLYAEKLSVLGQLAPKIAHEINNPLHVISANLQFSQMVIDDQEKVKSCMGKALKETDRIENLTRQLMDVARPTELNIQELSIKELLDNAILFLNDVGEIKRLEVRKDYEDELPSLRCDQAQLEQVFRNLIHNASQAMEEASIKVLTVSAKMSEKTKELEIMISDTGCGIEEENQEKIFEPFFTTKEKGKGNGLGMSIVKGIVERHQGRIQVESSVGMGTHFKVFLPLDPEKSL